jgi:hypothetical protein
MKNKIVSTLILFLFLYIPTLCFSQHGSGGAGAMGAFLLAIIIFLAIVVILSLIVIFINFRAYNNKAGKKSIMVGIVLSSILLIAFILAVISDGGPSILGIGLSIGSIIHLYSKKKIIYQNKNNDI